MLNISSHSAVRDGLVTVNHSIAGMQNGAVIDPSKVQYCVVNPHSPGTDFAFSRDVEKYLPQDADLFGRYIRSENDSGVSLLTRILLDLHPGGLALTVEPSRGVVDANRLTASAAIRNVLSPGAPVMVRRLLGGMHEQILDAINKTLGALPKNVRILDLHSMEPFSTPNQPPLAHDNLAAFLEAYATRPLDEATRRAHDIIIGTNGKEPVADMQMSEAVARLLRESGSPVGYNDPYDTDPNYPDYQYMVNSPDRVFEIDLLKTALCSGSGEDRSFDTTNPVVDERRVLVVAELLQEALRRSRVS